MTAPHGPRAGRIDFAALAAELLQRIETLVPEWLHGGTRDGHEWKGQSSRTGGPGDSWKVNMSTGVWGHFASGRGGRDLVGLYAELNGKSQFDAARELISAYHLQHVMVADGAPPGQATPGRAGASEPSSPAAKKSDDHAGKHKPVNTGEKGEFVPVVPVPDHAPPPPARHSHRGEPSHTWRYTRDGATLGYVYRFTTSDGGKEVLPVVWATSQVDGTSKWVWKTWNEPRPLYLPGGRLRPGLMRVVVEGEKCADALHAVLGDEFDVLSWPGGGNAASKADWAWLNPVTATEPAPRVILWPDFDAQRVKLSSAGKTEGLDPASKPYLTDARQPGRKAMATVGGILHAQGAQLWLCPLPLVPATPDGTPELPDGWDCYDAIHTDGWDADRLRAFLRAAKRWEPVAAGSGEGMGTAGPAGATALRSAGAGNGQGGGADDPQAWRLAIMRTGNGAPKPVRENVVLALQSLAETRGLIQFNEFTNDVEKMAAMPWGTPAGKWQETDELFMGEWLARQHGLGSMPRGTLEEGMRMVATRYQYHPVRTYIKAQVWDGTPRLNTWLVNAVVAEPEKIPQREARYLQRVGAWFLMGMVARAMWPGCKFDYMPIFESQQGMRKSTLLNILAGEWFADTGFVLGDKDSLQMLQGRWLYEISELDAMARAEVTKIKAFVASRADWYRASFDKRPREYPRQLVFAGTTNEHQYLVDGTGNRRFWPIRVTRVIDTEWVASVRDQLFAEAWARIQKGERFHPTQQEELRLFLLEQRERMVESPIEYKVLDYLVNHADGSLLKQVQIVNLLGAIGIDITKLGPGRFHEKAAGTALRKFGWERVRSNKDGRPWVYVRPANWPHCINLDDELDVPTGTAPKTEATDPEKTGANFDPPAKPPATAQAPADDIPHTTMAEPADYDDSDPF